MNTKTQKYPRELKDYYKDAYNKAIESGNISDSVKLLDFVKAQRVEVLKLIESSDNTTDINWIDVAKDLRKNGKISKYFPLSTLQKIVQYSSGGELDVDDILSYPENSVIQNPAVLETSIPRTEHLITSQSDHSYSFMSEWISNAVDASSPHKQIGRFGEGFFQSLSKLSTDTAQIQVISQSMGSDGYRLSLKQKDGQYLISSEQHKTENTGTKVSLKKNLSEQERQEIQSYISSKFGTNTRSSIYLNGKRINNFSEYTYLNGVDEVDENLPETHITIDESGISVQDSGSGMDANALSGKLLYPNTTSKERKKVSDEDVEKNGEKETRFFYKNKTNKKDKTHIYLQVAGVVIEDFSVETLGDIGECVFEFPSFSPLEDSRNEIKVGRETTVSLVAALKKIATKSKNRSEKLALLEIISHIYNLLKDRPSNIVDEKFTLSSNMKKAFKNIREDIEKEGITVLPGQEKLMNAIGQRDDVFYISPEFIDFQAESIPGALEFTDSIVDTPSYGKYSGYRFFEIPFDAEADHDYLVHEKSIFINSAVLSQGENTDEIIEVLNTSLNLNTSYEIESDKIFYGRIPTSSEGEIVKTKPRKKSEATLKKPNFGDTHTNNTANKKISQEEQEVIYQEQSKYISQEYNAFIKRHSGKVECIDFSEKNFYESRILECLGLEQSLDDIILGLCHISLFTTEFKHLGLASLVSTVRDINSHNIAQKLREYLELVEEFLSTKNTLVAKPTMDFLNHMVGNMHVLRSEDNLGLATNYTKTLFKILENEPNYILDIMERFKGDGFRVSGYPAVDEFDIFSKIIDAKTVVDEEELLKEIDALFEDDLFSYTDIDAFCKEYTSTHISTKRPETYKLLCYILENVHVGEFMEFKEHFLYPNASQEELVAEVRMLGDVRDIADMNEAFAVQELLEFFKFLDERNPKSQEPEKVENKEYKFKRTNLMLIAHYYFEGNKSIQCHMCGIIERINSKNFSALRSDILKLTDEEVTWYDMHGIDQSYFENINMYATTKFFKEIFSEEINEKLDGKYSISTNLKKEIFDVYVNNKDQKIFEEVFKILDSFPSDSLYLFRKNMLSGKMSIASLSDAFAQADISKFFEHRELDFIYGTLLYFFQQEIKSGMNHLFQGDSEELEGEDESFDLAQWEAYYKNSFLNKDFNWDNDVNAQAMIPNDIEVSEITGVLPKLKQLKPHQVLKIRDIALGYETNVAKINQDNIAIEKLGFNTERLNSSFLLYHYFTIEDKMIREINISWKSFERGGSFDRVGMSGKTSFGLTENHGDLLGGRPIDNKVVSINLEKTQSSFEDINKVSDTSKNHLDYINYLTYSLSVDDTIHHDDKPSEGKSVDFMRTKYDTPEESKFAFFIDVFTAVRGNNPETHFKKYIPSLRRKVILLSYLPLISMVKPQDEENKFNTHHLELQKKIGSQEDIANLQKRLEREIMYFFEHVIFYDEKFFDENELMVPNFKITDLFSFFREEYVFSKGNNFGDYCITLDFNEEINSDTVDIGSEKELETKDEDTQKTKLGELPEDFFMSLSGAYEEDIIAFAQFLESDGDFLANRDSVVTIENPSIHTSLSQVIHTSMKHNSELTQGVTTQEFGSLLLESEKRGTHYNDIISGVCIAQDEVSMYYLREGVQNARDALLKSSGGGEIHIDTYARDGYFSTSISDSVGMSLDDVVIKLLTPYNSGKTGTESTGKFGKGFFTFAVGAKELRIKTSTGNGSVSYIKLIPNFKDGVVYDFEVEIENKQENFKGTTIERVDELSGIGGNLRALIGTNLLKKYTGNIEGVDINYNSQLLNNPEGKQILGESADIYSGEENLGTLKIFKSKDRIERFTKDNLWISEIKQDLISDFPDWIVEYIRKNKISIDIPSGTPLVGSRNSLENKEHYISLFKPHIYRIIISQVLKDAVTTSLKIPMMPEDYLALLSYEQRGTSLVPSLADTYNSGGDLSKSDINSLKDPAAMAQFLTLVEFEYQGSITSLRKIKKDVHNKTLDKRDYSGDFVSKIGLTERIMDGLNSRTKQKKLSYKQIEKISGVTQTEIETFRSFVQETFKEVIAKNGGIFDIDFHSDPNGGEMAFANKGFGLSFRVDAYGFSSLIRDISNPRNRERIIDVIAHEMTHNKEDTLGTRKWGTHETDETHDESFMKLNRGILTTLLRSLAT